MDFARVLLDFLKILQTRKNVWNVIVHVSAAMELKSQIVSLVEEIDFILQKKNCVFALKTFSRLEKKIALVKTYIIKDAS